MPHICYPDDSILSSFPASLPPSLPPSLPNHLLLQPLSPPSPPLRQRRRAPHDQAISARRQCLAMLRSRQRAFRSPFEGVHDGRRQPQRTHRDGLAAAGRWSPPQGTSICHGAANLIRHRRLVSPPACPRRLRDCLGSAQRMPSRLVPLHDGPSPSSGNGSQQMRH